MKEERRLKGLCSSNQPRDFDMSWALTEPAIYYQAAYVKLLSKFVD